MSNQYVILSEEACAKTDIKSANAQFTVDTNVKV